MEKKAEPEQPDFASQLKNRLKKKTSDGPADGVGNAYVISASTPNLEIGSSWKKKHDSNGPTDKTVPVDNTPPWKKKQLEKKEELTPPTGSGIGIE